MRRHPYHHQGQLPARQALPRGARRRRRRGPDRQLQLHAARPGLRRGAQPGTQPGRHSRRRPRRPAGLVRRSVAGRGPHRGRQAAGAGSAAPDRPPLRAALRLLQDPVPRVRGLAGRTRRARRPAARRPPLRHGDLEPPLRVPAGRRDQRHQPPAAAQRLHHRRQRRPGQDLDRAGGDQVLRAAQRTGAGAVPQAAAGQLAALRRLGRPGQQPVRAGSPQLHRARAHRPEPLGRPRRADRPGQLQLGGVRSGGDRRVAQLPQRGARPHRRGRQDRAPQPL